MGAETQALLVRYVIPLNVNQNWYLMTRQYDFFFSPRRNSQLGPRPPHFLVFQVKFNKTHTPPWYDSSTSDRPGAKTSTSQHSTLTRDRYPCPRRDRTRNPSKRAAADPRLSQRGHWDGRDSTMTNTKFPFTECPKVSCGLTERSGETEKTICGISDFSRPIFRGPLPPKTPFLDSSPLKMGPIGWPETSVRNYH